MQISARDFHQLLHEHQVLARAYHRVQERCSELLHAQRQAVARLEAEAMRLLAALIRRDSELAWAKEDRMELEQAIPGLPRRAMLARRVHLLQERIHELGRERTRKAPATQVPDHGGQAGLEAALAAADLVICQAGCMSHGAVWRVQDHCKRTGKPCVLVDKPDALRVVRIQPGNGNGGAARFTAPLEV